VRNIALGHQPVEFPTGFWLTLAARSGAEFGWPLLALLVFLAHFRHKLRGSAIPILVGLALVLGGLVPSMVWPHRMGLIEWALLGAGGVLLWRASWPAMRENTLVMKAGWAVLLALPYFVTWFYSYSYHYRLSFPIVPLMIVPTAAIIGQWIHTARLNTLRKAVYLAGVTLAALPAIVIPLYDVGAGWDWLWTDKLPDDVARYRSGNDALMWVVEGLQAYLEENPDAPLVVVAPGIKRLPFFFPLADIRIDEMPTRLRELEGVTYFIDSSPEGRGAYADQGIADLHNQAISALARRRYNENENSVIRHAWWKDDGIFRYDVYELHLERRFVNPQMIHDPEEAVIFGDFARFRGHSIGADTFWPGRPVYMELHWEVLAAAPEDYTVYIHLRDADGNVQAAWDGPVTNTEDGRYYSTLVWEAGEFIRDDRLLRITAEQNVPAGEGYTIVFGLYNLQTNARVPVTVGGEAAGDGYTINERLSVLATPPE
jgi:hypothetical protein